MSVEEESWLNLCECDALVLDVDGVRYSAAEVSMRSCTFLYSTVSCNFDLLVSRDSNPSWSSMSVTL